MKEQMDQDDYEAAMKNLWLMRIEWMLSQDDPCDDDNCPFNRAISVGDFETLDAMCDCCDKFMGCKGKRCPCKAFGKEAALQMAEAILQKERQP